MNIRFSVNSAGRKALARAIGEIVGEDAVYTGTPTFAYAIGDYTVDREGIMTFPEDSSNEEMRQVIMSLRERGYEPSAEETSDYHSLQMTGREELGLGRERRDHPGEDGPQPSDVPETDDDGNDKLVIDMPLDGFTVKAIENLGEIVASKNRLIKKALGANSLRIDVTDDKLRFPWFTLTDTDGEIDAYMRLVTALCLMAKRQKRVIARECEIVNEKFMMRVFLIRLGFVGPEFKTARKILMRNLEGNTAWKSGQRPERTAAEQADNNIGEVVSDEK